MQVIKQHIVVLTPIDEVNRITKVIERAARICYQSEHNITNSSAEPFVRKLINRQHGAMLEHANLQVKFVTDRATANALVRHRHCAFAQESTHFIDYGKREELIFIEQEGIKDRNLYWNALQAIEEIYMLANKEDRKVRRSLLPLALKTELIITASIREWRHILKIRTSAGVHPQMKALITELYYWFKTNLPIFIDDIDLED